MNLCFNRPYSKDVYNVSYLRNTENIHVSYFVIFGDDDDDDDNN